MNEESRLEQLLTALLLVALENREEQGLGKGVKTEVLLRKAGMKTAEIATILGKNEAAVKKAIQRGR